MKKEYLKPEMAEILVQTCGVLAASDPNSVTSTFSTTDADGGFGKASEYSGNGGDEDW